MMHINSKERGMIFNSEMVRAILSGQKTQTRRIVKCNFQEIAGRDDGSLWPWREDCEHAEDYWYPCPFGDVGDRIWVRETWQGPLVDFERSDDLLRNPEKYEKPENCVYAADGVPAPEFYDADDNLRCCWRPSIHMPRWASRILLEITNVRVERLNDISEEDARSEGVTPKSIPAEKLVGGKLAFAELWASIYGYENWQANPWVWVIEFKRVQEQSND